MGTLATTSRGGGSIRVKFKPYKDIFPRRFNKNASFLWAETAFLIAKHHKHYKIMKSQKQAVKTQQTEKQNAEKLLKDKT